MIALQLHHAAGTFFVAQPQSSERFPLSEVLEKSEYSGKVSPWNYLGNDTAPCDLLGITLILEAGWRRNQLRFLLPT